MIAFDRQEDVWGPRRARIIAGVLAVVFTVIVGRSAFVAVHGPEKGASAGGVVAAAGGEPFAVEEDLEALFTPADGFGRWTAQDGSNVG